MDRGERRYKTQQKQRKRQKTWSALDWEVEDDTTNGKLRDTHFGCGCPMCKPWKHGLDNELKISEQRKLDDVGED